MIYCTICGKETIKIKDNIFCPSYKNGRKCIIFQKLKPIRYYFYISLNKQMLPTKIFDMPFRINIENDKLSVNTCDTFIPIFSIEGNYLIDLDENFNDNFNKLVKKLEKLIIL